MTANDIKRLLYDGYAQYSIEYFYLAMEISHRIPSCKLECISKSHDGIHLNFQFDGNLNKDDISFAVSNALKEMIFSLTHVKENKKDLQDFVDNTDLSSIFNVLIIGDKFTIIL